MNRLIEWIDRLKLVEGLILFGTVWFGVEWFSASAMAEFWGLR